MERNETISSRQLMILVILFTVGTTILITPSGLAAFTKQDAWISVLIGMAESVLILALYTVLAKRHPQLSLVEMSDKLLGRWPGAIVSLAFAGFGFISAATVIWEIGNFVTTELMDETPFKAIDLMFGVLVIIGTRLGIEVLGRSAELAFPFVVLLFIALVVFSLPKVEFNNIQPVLEAGIKLQLKASLIYSSVAVFPIVVFLMVMPSQTANPGKAATALWIAMLTSGIAMVLVVLLDILALRADIAARTTYVTYLLAGKISLFGFIQRFEAVVAGIWLTGIYYKTCLYYYAGVRGLAQVLKLRDYRPLVVPLGISMIVIAHNCYPDMASEKKWLEESWVPYTIANGLLLPALVLGVGWLRKSRK